MTMNERRPAVTLYSGVNYSGKSYELKLDRDTSLEETGLDKIASVKVPADLQVRLFVPSEWSLSPTSLRS
ncbi:hypothetical protein ACFYYB_40765 [Streptomyces sp. NPDC002886]|uniref:hypothetical protein n=1 Tax=Streptomyces sp. NPDC002886 TaxID=3364667 RepID=UPI0036CFEDE3